MSSLFVTMIVPEEPIQLLLKAESMLVKIIKMMEIVPGDFSTTPLRVEILEPESQIFIV